MSDRRDDWNVPAVLATPRAAYVHVPFCRHRCGYCNFSVIHGRDDLGDAYLDALQVEFEQLGEPHSVDTVFIGGGTPSHLSMSWLERFVELVSHWLPRSSDAEFTMEANPSDVTSEKLGFLKQAGLNRISLGVQSFEARKLRSLERDHTPDVARYAIDLAAELIGNVSIDLIFAAPEETPADWQIDIDQAVASPIQHLSTYALTFEKGTRFWNQRSRGAMSALPEDDQLVMYSEAIARLTDTGFEHYEVSNFARDGRVCQHNITYWKGAGWFGFGPSAARFVDGRREVNHRSPTSYIKKLKAGVSATAESEQLTVEQLARERIAFGLRMLSGVELSEIESLVSPEELVGATIREYESHGLLDRSDSRIFLTRKGLMVSDSILSGLLSCRN